ncbi:acid stress response protein YqgB [Phytobacter sp. V91]
MTKKPVAQSAIQHFMLENQAAYGLLSQCNIVIVVNCFTLLPGVEVRYV